MGANVVELLNVDLVKPKLESIDKEGAIAELTTLIEKNGFLNDRQKFLDAVLERETLGSTGVGMGIAIPHGKSEAVKKACVAMGKSESGVDFKSLDGSPAHLIFLIAVPNSAENEHLKILAKLSRMLMHQNFREALLKATLPEDIIKIIQKHELS